ncbi:MAG: small subunit ribosomal protein S20 [Chlamydiales bacterium]|jgi:small subunit ribosomal protein S20
MPISKQAKKRVVQDERRRAANKITATRMKSSMKKVLNAATAEEAKLALPDAVKRVDKAAKKGILHENAAAHRKSRLAKAVASKS